MRFMQTESVLQTKNRSGPAKNRFSVALHTRIINKILAIYWMTLVYGKYLDINLLPSKIFYK